MFSTIDCATTYYFLFPFNMAQKNIITLETIAEKTGVSKTTISRVLNGKAKNYRISDKTAQKVLAVARELNFIPNPLARGLRLQKTLTIGLAIPDISNPFFASIARSVERETRKLGYSVILVDTEEDTGLERESLILMQGKADGFIVSPVGLISTHLEEIYQDGTPLVIIDRYFENSILPYVASDNFHGSLEVVKYLIDAGHKKIACIQGLRNTTPNTLRVKGYEQAHIQAGIPINDSFIVGDSFGEQNGYIETKLLLKNREQPTAIFAVSNLISLGAIRAIEEEGFSIPDDISIVAFDDQPYSNFLKTPMTTIAQQNVEMGHIAVRLLFSQIQSGRSMQGKSVLLPTKLIKRQSVKNIFNPVSMTK